MTADSVMYPSVPPRLTAEQLAQRARLAASECLHCRRSALSCVETEYRTGEACCAGCRDMWSHRGET